MSDTSCILTVTDRYPSAARPGHGRQIHERNRRLAPSVGARLAVWECDPRRSVEESAVHDDFEGVPVVRLGAEVRGGLFAGLRGRRRAREDGVVATVLAAVDAARAEHRDVLLDVHGVRPWVPNVLRAAARLGVPAWSTPGVAGLARVAALREPLQRVAAAARSWLVDSAACGARLQLELGVTALPLQVLRDGVDLELFVPAPAGASPGSFRAEHGIPADAALCVAFAPVTEASGIPKLAAALRDLPTAVHLAVAGVGEASGRMRSLAPPGRVHEVGDLVPEARAWLFQAADLTVLPGVLAPTVPAFAESLAAGVRVLATPTAGDPALLANPGLGALVRDGDRRALGREILRLLRTPSDPQRIRGFAQRFSWDDPIGKLADSFRDALQ